MTNDPRRVECPGLGGRGDVAFNDVLLAAPDPAGARATLHEPFAFPGGGPALGLLWADDAIALPQRLMHRNYPSPPSPSCSTRQSWVTAALADDGLQAGSDGRA